MLSELRTSRSGARCSFRSRSRLELDCFGRAADFFLPGFRPRLAASAPSVPPALQVDSATDFAVICTSSADVVTAPI